MDNSEHDWWREKRTLAAQPAAAEPGAVAQCPKCARKLLSTRSILCNWCGARIDDPEYLERAAQERAEMDAQVRQQINQELSEAARFGIVGRLKQKGKNGASTRVNVLFPPDK